MREVNLRRTLGLIVSLAGLGPAIPWGCGGSLGDASGPTEAGTPTSGEDATAFDASSGNQDAAAVRVGNGNDAGRGGGPSDTGSAGEAGPGGDSASASESEAGACGLPTFQCPGPCVCSGSWVIDHESGTSVSPSTACDLMKQAWPNGGNVPFGNVCQTACGDTTAMQCSVSDAYTEAFQAANQNAGTDASAYVCPPVPDGSATVTLACESEHYDPHAGCSWTQCITGRRPDGLEPALPPGCESKVAVHFGECARLEAASIIAFERMRAELKVLGAPPALMRLTRRAAREETRHARITRALARRFGGRPPRPAFAAPRPRALVEMALENAAEGLVRETFGAAVALWQAGHARDTEVRRAMQQIAEDECRHAELSRRVACWLHAKLNPEERERVSSAIREAIATLRREVSGAPDPTLCDVAGLPSAAQARVLLALLLRDVWAGEAART
jgi:hypothetical protein